MLLSNKKKSTTEILPFAIEIQNPNEILLISNEMKNPNEKLTFSNGMKKQTKVAVMMFFTLFCDCFVLGRFLSSKFNTLFI
jgi:hypothetical protein